MNSYPRQAKEIESLTSQLSAARKLSDSLAAVVERQRTELMALREKVLLLEQRPTAEDHREVLGQCVKLGRRVSRLETELEIARVQATPPKAERRSVGPHVTQYRICDCPMCEARGV